MTQIDPANSILVLYPPNLDPFGFVERLTTPDYPCTDNDCLIPWRLDNKYYTANVTLQLVELDTTSSPSLGGYEVVIYLFSAAPKTLPPALVKALVDEPRDIALAIRTLDSEDEEDQSSSAISEDDVEDIFAEVGLELIDERAKPEDDDERPISPMETIKQTLMTHFWPSMVRKPLGKGLSELPPDTGSDGGLSDDEPDMPEAGPSFPTPFDASRETPVANEKERDDEGSAFPDLAELKAQLEMDDFDRFDDLVSAGRFQRLEEMFGEMDEYAQLDEWLDTDDPDPGPTHGAQSLGVKAGGDDTDLREPDLQEGISSAHAAGNDEFEDDFDDFAAFQTAPPPRDTSLSLDPTPLLLHLQNVRAELAGVGDEDERRVRAGKEVARVMRDLGIGEGFDLDDLDDERENKQAGTI